MRVGEFLDAACALITFFVAGFGSSEGGIRQSLRHVSNKTHLTKNKELASLLIVTYPGSVNQDTIVLSTPFHKGDCVDLIFRNSYKSYAGDVCNFDSSSTISTNDAFEVAQ